MSSLIILLTIATAVKGNDSTAKAQLSKAKTNAGIGIATTAIGCVLVYNGILKLNQAQTNLGLLACGAGAVFCTVATFQYQSAQVEARLGFKSMGLTIKF